MSDKVEKVVVNAMEIFTDVGGEMGAKLVGITQASDPQAV